MSPISNGLGNRICLTWRRPCKLDPWPNHHGVAIKIGYDLNGQPVEEAFFGVYYISKQGTDAVR